MFLCWSVGRPYKEEEKYCLAANCKLRNHLFSGVLATNCKKSTVALTAWSGERCGKRWDGDFVVYFFFALFFFGCGFDRVCGFPASKAEFEKEDNTMPEEWVWQAAARTLFSISAHACVKPGFEPIKAV